MTESVLLFKGPCADCGSSDACGNYDDGHTYCHSCNTHHQNGTGSPSTGGRSATASKRGLLTDVTPVALDRRGITEETCRKMGYGAARYDGLPAQIATYYDEDGNPAAQKIRLPGKDFRFIGETKEAMPFGAHAWQRTGKTIVVTEGEIDALTMAQVQGLRWPVVSIGCGADTDVDKEGNALKNPGSGIRRYFARWRDYFLGFDKIILMFDADRPGRFSAKVAAEVLGPKAHIAEMPQGCKDPNDALTKGLVKDLVDAMWRAKQWKPEGIVAMADLREAVMQAPSMGPAYPWEGLTKATYGLHFGEIVLIVAGTGIGKTDLTYEIITQQLMEHGEKVAGFFLEETPAGAAKLVAGKHASRRFHIPDGGWTQDELVEAFDAVAGTGRFFIYDAKGENGWSSIKSKIEYLVNAEGVRVFVVDNTTSIVGEGDDERLEVDKIMREMEALVVRYGITIYLCAHTNKSDGKPHEEGGRVTLANIRMSGSIKAKSWVVLALERNTQADDPEERKITTVRILKMRRDGSRVGTTFTLKYDVETGRLMEAEPPPTDFASAFNDTGPANPAGPSDF
jgi:twinkle protein